LVSVNANRTATRSFDRREVARSRFVRVETAGCALRVVPVRELLGVGVPVLPPDRDADPDAGDEGDAGEGAAPARVGVVTIGGVTGVGAGVVVRGGAVVTVTCRAGAGGSAVVTGGGGGSAVVTGSGGGGGSAVVTGSGGGGGRAVVTGGSAVVTGSDGVVTVTPGTGGGSSASACAETRPARAAAKPKRLPRRDIPKLQRTIPVNGCGELLT
jgi:hypothetical protein